MKLYRLSVTFPRDCWWRPTRGSFQEVGSSYKWINKRSVGPERLSVRDNRSCTNNVGLMKSYPAALKRRILVLHPNICSYIDDDCIGLRKVVKTNCSFFAVLFYNSYKLSLFVIFLHFQPDILSVIFSQPAATSTDQTTIISSKYPSSTLLNLKQVKSWGQHITVWLASVLSS